MHIVWVSAYSILITRFLHFYLIARLRPRCAKLVHLLILQLLQHEELVHFRLVLAQRRLPVLSDFCMQFVLPTRFRLLVLLLVFRQEFFDFLFLFVVVLHIGHADQSSMIIEIAVAPLMLVRRLRPGYLLVVQFLDLVRVKAS